MIATTATTSAKRLPGLRMTGTGFRTLVRTQARLLRREPGAVLAGIALLGSAAVLSVGLLIAALAPTSAAATGFGMPLMIVNFFFDGLYVPLQQLPAVLRTISGFVPFGAVVDTWSGIGSAWRHLAVLAAWTLLGGFAAARCFKWE